MVNHWHRPTNDPAMLADHLWKRGLNLTAIEYVPGTHEEWSTSCDPGRRGPDPAAVVTANHREKLRTFVREMRRRGIWTMINIVNANGCLQRRMDTIWFQGEFNFILQQVGPELVILQAVSEWPKGTSDEQTRQQQWATIVRNQWPGYKSWNRPASVTVAQPDHMLEFHPCDAPEMDNWQRRPDTIVNTDCTSIIDYLNNGVPGGAGPANSARVADYVAGVLSGRARSTAPGIPAVPFGGGVHFVYYGAQNVTPDTNALDGIRAGITAAGVFVAALPATPPATPPPTSLSNVFVTMGQADFDGDGKTDVAVWRRNTAQWFIRRSSDASVQTVVIGAPQLGDIPVPADYLGDGRADLAVYRASVGQWLIHDWGASHQVNWGSPLHGDIPVPAEYEGDGKANIAVYRSTSGQWWVLRHNGQCLAPCPVTWGNSELGDIPVPADYDGDGKADIAVYRRTTGQWFILRSSDGGLTMIPWGSPSPLHSDLPVPAKYTTSAKADIAVYRQTTGEWWIRRATDGGQTLINFGSRSTSVHPGTGLLGDVPVPGAYTVAGLASVALFRRSSADWLIPGFPTFPFGTSTFNVDVPVP
jgi:hypothetical protein